MRRATFMMRSVFATELPAVLLHDDRHADDLRVPSLECTGMAADGATRAGGRGAGLGDAPAARGGDGREAAATLPGERRRHRRVARLWRPPRSALDVGGVRAARAAQVGVELLVAETHLAFVGLAAPQAGRRRLVDHRLRYAEVARQLAHGRLGEVAQRQQIDAAVAVLGEVADGQLAGIAGADHAVAQVVGEGVEGGHA